MQRSISESGRHITMDGDELCARGRGECVSRVCVCEILRQIKPMKRMCVYVMDRNKYIRLLTSNVMVYTIQYLESLLNSKMNTRFIVLHNMLKLT